MQIFTAIYNHLQALGVLDIIDAGESYSKSRASGFMDLSLDVLYRDDMWTVIALAHNYIQNGDVMADPDMQIAIHNGAGIAEALSLQQDGVLQSYQEVYDQFPNPSEIQETTKTELNRFLVKWLKTTRDQGHHFTIEAAA